MGKALTEHRRNESSSIELGSLQLSSAIASSSKFQLVSPVFNAVREHSLLGQIFCEKIDRLCSSDPLVKSVVELVRETLRATKHSQLSQQLSDPRSDTYGVIDGYLKWVALRNEKAPRATPEEQASAKESHPAFQQVQVANIVDGVLLAMLRTGEQITYPDAEIFLKLFTGAAERIQFRVGGFFLNGSINELVESEEAILNGTFNYGSLSYALKKLITLDGGSSIGYQARKEESLVISSDKGEGALVLKVDPAQPLAIRQADAAVISVAQQSSEVRKSLQIMQRVLGELLGAQSPDYPAALEVYHGYTTLLSFSSHMVWQFRGSLDRLFALTFSNGTQEQRELVLDLALNRARHIGSIVKDVPLVGNQALINVRTLYIATSNFLSCCEAPTSDSLQTAINIIDEISRMSSSRDLTPAKARQMYSSIINMRREELASVQDLKGAITVNKKGEELFKVNLSGYSIAGKVKNLSIDGRAERVLEISKIETSLVEDTECVTTLFALFNLARNSGFDSVEIRELQNIHLVRELREKPALLVVESVLDTWDSPSFVMRFTGERGRFSEYLAKEFNLLFKLDLSSEGEILNEAAERVKQEIGGKALGLKVLSEIVRRFGDSSIVVPYAEVSPPDSLVDSVSKRIKSGPIMVRSNASFEYGSPPGLLSSLKVINQQQIPSEVSAYLTMVSGQFRTVSEQGKLDSRDSMQFVVQSAIDVVSSGVVYSSFDGSSEDPVIIEGSIGPCVSATEGLADLVHIRVNKDKFSLSQNFDGDHPQIVFSNNTWHLSYEAADLSRHELQIYKGSAEQIEIASTNKLSELWVNNTYQLEDGGRSPFSPEQIRTISKFAKFAENQLGKPVKLEFGIAPNGTIAIWQMDPASLAVSDRKIRSCLPRSSPSLEIETPFTNMPVVGAGLHVVVEAVGFGSIPKDVPFALVVMTTPLNINFETELVKRYPNCRAVIIPGGSRVNHCYSQARTYFPVIGASDLWERITEKFGRLEWGYQEDLKINIDSNGRSARFALYR